MEGASLLIVLRLFPQQNLSMLASAYRLTPLLKILKKCVSKEQILVLKTLKLSTKYGVFNWR